MDFSTILEHPERDTIISKLLNGTDPKEVNQWLKLKYTDKDQKHLHLSIKILQDFAKSNYVNYFDQFNKDLAIVKDQGKLDKKMADSLLNNKSYQDRLNEYAEKKIDVEKFYTESIKIVTDRAIQVFDKIQENPGGFKGDYVLIKWFEVLFNALEKYDRRANNIPDQIIQHNYNIQYADQTNAIYQDVLREVFAELDPEVTFRIMDKLKEKLEGLKQPSEIKALPLEGELQEAQMLNQFIKSGSK